MRPYSCFAKTGAAFTCGTHRHPRRMTFGLRVAYPQSVCWLTTVFNVLAIAISLQNQPFSVRRALVLELHGRTDSTEAARLGLSMTCRQAGPESVLGDATYEHI